MGFNPTQEEVDDFNAGKEPWSLLQKVIVKEKLDALNNNMKPSENLLSKRASTIVGGVYDAGLHYRKSYKGIKLDPFRIADIYKLNGVQLTILKKTLVTGERGNKDTIQDYKDIINAASRAIEMIEEDEG